MSAVGLLLNVWHLTETIFTSLRFPLHPVMLLCGIISLLNTVQTLEIQFPEISFQTCGSIAHHVVERLYRAGEPAPKKAEFLKFHPLFALFTWRCTPMFLPGSPLSVAQYAPILCQITCWSLPWHRKQYYFLRFQHNREKPE